jgi:hypothetical protein
VWEEDEGHSAAAITAAHRKWMGILRLTYVDYTEV